MTESPAVGPALAARLVQDVRVGLATVADAEKAPQMQAYMKSATPFRGVSAVPLRQLCREIFGSARLPDADSWRFAVLQLWDDARFREERYAALELTRHRYYASYQDISTLALYRHLVVTGAWWDYVDGIAAFSVGSILRADPGRVAPLMRSWAISDDIWLRRTAILCQLKSKAATNVDLLRDVITENQADTAYGGEFFIRKSIGWALREYAKTDASWVQAFVDDLAARLSPLSRREALKNIAASAT